MNSSDNDDNSAPRSGPAPGFEQRVLRALSTLNSDRIEHMNRLLACEALLHSLLDMLPTPELRALQEKNDHTLDRLAAMVQPQLQRKERFETFSQTIAQLLRDRPPDRDESTSG